MGIPRRALLAGLSLAVSASAPAPSEWPSLPVREATLDNGLQVLVVERRTSPTIAFYLHYRVGTVDERGGTLGLSHMLEHLLFKGTRRLGTRDWAREKPILEEIDRVGETLDRERARPGGPRAREEARLEERLAELLERERRHIVKDELIDILQRAGAEPIDASTWPDATNYYSVIPSGRAEVWLAATGEQMADPVLREFYPERDVVMEERRLRVEDDPEGRLVEALAALAFAVHPYRNSDWMSELERLTRADALRHFETYYGASNAVLAVVGDVQADALLRLARRHLSRLPRRPPPPDVRVVEPPQAGERRAVVEFEARPQLAMAFHVPELGHADDPPLALLSAVLGGHGTATAFESGAYESTAAARWSRLYRRLVEERATAQSVSVGGYPGDRYPRALVILAEPREPHDLAELEKEVLAEIGALAREPVPGRELERARRNLRALYLAQLESNLGTAWLLGFAHGVAGDWRALERYVADLDRVTPEDVRRVARAYLHKRNRSVVWRVPPRARGEGERGGAAGGGR